MYLVTHCRMGLCLRYQSKLLLVNYMVSTAFSIYQHDNLKSKVEIFHSRHLAKSRYI